MLLEVTFNQRMKVNGKKEKKRMKNEWRKEKKWKENKRKENRKEKTEKWALAIKGAQKVKNCLDSKAQIENT